MCGIVGFLSNQSLSAENGRKLTTAMADAIRQRGPDAQGHWGDPEHGVFLGHRRLSILELSAAGNQPMQSSCGRFQIAFNGEIYNHQSLRKEIPPMQFRGNSDTETLLECLRHFGLQKTLSRIHGMFAFALVDREEHCLYLVRDRLGEKPLYFGRTGSAFLFASELSSFRAFPDFSREIDDGALAEYLRLGCVPSDLSIYKNAKKLLPGTMLKLRLPWSDSLPEFERYWYPPKDETGEEGDDNYWEAKLRKLLERVVKEQMLSDVPLGVFLSGGIDSSLIAAVMRSVSDSPVRSFTISFPEKGYDESEAASEVARVIGTEHMTFPLKEKDAIDLVPQLASVYAEPFADSSQVATLLLCRMTRTKVKVALTGDGGDEVFLGYNRYTEAPGLWNKIEKIPGPMRRALSFSMDKAPAGFLHRTLPYLSSLPQPVDKFYKIADLLHARSPHDVYRSLVSVYPNPQELLHPDRRGAAKATATVPLISQKSLAKYFRELDLFSYLPDDILVKLDRAAMSTSLETRAPFLDDRVLEFALKLPERQCLRGGRGKCILRRLLEKHVPRHILDRPKTGFSVPVSSWLRGPLRDWAESQLSETRIVKEGVLDAKAVRGLWLDLLENRRERPHALWAVLQLQAWLEKHSS